jgi:transcriptional regulator with XRE-family HTH domain
MGGCVLTHFAHTGGIEVAAKSPAQSVWYGRLEQAMADRQMSAYRLAQQIGLQPSRFTHWKQGRGKPDLHQAWAIAQALDVPLEWLADPGDRGPAPPARSPEEQILLEVVREIGPMAAMRILVSQGAAAARAGQQPTPVRSVEVKPPKGG